MAKLSLKTFQDKILIKGFYLRVSQELPNRQQKRGDKAAPFSNLFGSQIIQQREPEPLKQSSD